MMSLMLATMILSGCDAVLVTTTSNHVANGEVEAKTVTVTLTAETPTASLTAVPTTIATDTPVPTATPIAPTFTPMPPTDAHTSGTGTIRGAFANNTGLPLSGWLWLATVTSKGVTGDDAYEVITTYVELIEAGTFTFDDVPPGEYLIIGFLVLSEDSHATVTIANSDAKMIFPFYPPRGPFVALVEEYDKSAIVGEYKDYIRVGSTGGWLYPSHEYISIMSGEIIDLGQIQADD